MADKEKEQFLDDVSYFWTEKGDVTRLAGFTIEKLEEADPILARAYKDMELATEAFSRLLEYRI